MSKILISIYPFAEYDNTPLKLLNESGFEYDVNPLKRKLNEEELFEIITNYDSVIAGTEPFTEKVIANAKKLRHISRVGSGINSIDLNIAKEKKITISYTPDAPINAVAEFTIGLFLCSLRGIHISNQSMTADCKWNRVMGRSISEVTIGIIGVGKIATNVITSLINLGANKIVVNDIHQDLKNFDQKKVNYVSKEYLYKNSDVISIHVPLTSDTYHLISDKELSMMKDNAALINTSRGQVVNESDLYSHLERGRFASVALDVFENEPYIGPLINFQRCLLTSHISSMTIKTRLLMETQAVKDTLLFLRGHSLKNELKY